MRSREPHYINDQNLQLAYSYPAPWLRNPWTNLFVNRGAVVAATDFDEICDWVREDNYFDDFGRPALAAILADPPAAWDVDGHGAWPGHLPDCFYGFAEEGFDRTPEGRLTGWRAFACQPPPGTFWPTNGSPDDVLIRLPAAYLEDAQGRQSLHVHKTNLAIVEALIKRADIPVPPTDKAAMGVDLDRDGALGTAPRVVFATLKGVTMRWAGRAGALLVEEAPSPPGSIRSASGSCTPSATSMPTPARSAWPRG
ncbi:hypothetical protein [Rubrimonas cliftonensis]|uniref:Uncharacterized protein n=1 Tax=Rubrimonas cliftonensis TaxID=89524 RepID=A0A1H4FWN6_9RHOB|nr:hypothetical protein [Rubrimonas cliftonensis]SEB00912.1 hypothetical protein SAMN05444370_1295 [Rubrimonas cliftonensis]